MIKGRVNRRLAVMALSTAMTACVAGAGAVGYAKLDHAVSVSADTASYALLQQSAKAWEDVKFSQSSPLQLTLGTSVASGQYCITVKVTAVEGSSEDYYEITATGTGDTVYLSMSSAEGEEDTYYGVVTVTSDGTLTLETTSENELTANVSLDSLFLSAGNGFYLQDVEIPAATESEGVTTPSTLDIDIVGADARNFTVQIDFGSQITEAIYATIGGVRKQLTRLENTGFNTYAVTIELPEGATATKLTLTSSNTVALVGSVSLYQFAVHTVTNNTATARNVPVWNTAIFSYTADKTGYISANITSDAEVYVSTTVSKTAGNYSGSPVTGENYPLYVVTGTTYYFEATLEGINSDTATTADLTITISDWEAPAQVSGIFAMPVTPTKEYESKLSVATAGQYTLSIIDLPFDYYDRDVVITAHIGTNTYALNRGNNYLAVVNIVNGEPVYFTTSETTHTTLTFSLEEYHEIHYIALNTATPITVPANGTITYFVQAAASGVYSITLQGDTSAISVYGDNNEIIPAGATSGGFVVRFDGVDYGIEFRNSSNDEVKITATVSVDASAALQLGVESSIELTAGQRKSLFMYNLSADTFNVTVDPATDIALTVDGEAVALTDGKGTVTITSEQEVYGVVNFTFTNNGAESATCKVKVTPTSNTINAGDTIDITTGTDYEYITTYYAMVTAGNTYALTLDFDSDVVSVIVTQNGESLVFYGGMAGAFTAQADGYVILRISCYNYSGSPANVKAYFNNAGTMSVNEKVTVTVNENDKMYSYVTYLYEGRYHFDLTNSAVKVAINGTILTESYFDIYNYDKVTVTFIYDGEGTFDATLVPNTMLTLGVESQITLTAYQSNSYYIDLPVGEYVITLTLSDGSRIQVMLNGTQVIAAGAISNSFEITSNGYYALTFYNVTETETTFSVIVTVLE